MRSIVRSTCAACARKNHLPFVGPCLSHSFSSMTSLGSFSVSTRRGHRRSSQRRSFSRESELRAGEVPSVVEDGHGSARFR